ncbi:MAG: aminoglycoside phosphotransferase family protein [Oscillospiraceae bacterium]|nr:aminoglycoside phosphotransferase family protein [Oscillospiraceae bacterium]
MIYKELLSDYFDISPNDVREIKGGWSAKAYRVESANNMYFLKAYDKSLMSVQPWINRIGDYIPVLGWLSETPELRGRIVKPVKSLNGDYKIEMQNHVFLLFDYVTGDTPGKNGLTCRQLAELAEILALLHCFDEHAPCDTSGLHEDISLDFCIKLERYLSAAEERDELSRLVFKEADILHSAIDKTIWLRDTVRLNAQPIVLCHADAHKYNVIQSRRLVLADWEDLRLAPAESDLFMYALDPNWNEFLNAYKSIRHDFHINIDLLNFYLIRRRLDDIWADISRILYDNPSKDETLHCYELLKVSFSETRQLLNLLN